MGRGIFKGGNEAALRFRWLCDFVESSMNTSQMESFLQGLDHLSLPRELAKAAPACKTASPGSLQQASPVLSNANLSTIGTGPCR